MLLPTQTRGLRSTALLLLLPLWLAVYSMAIGVAASISKDERLEESLVFEQFNDGRILSLFNFTRILDQDSVTKYHDRHFGLFPKSLADIIETFGVIELHLTFTQGRWKYERWGYNSIAAAPGVQLWAWLNSTKPDKDWKGLTNALAGLFCASLNYIDQSVTSVPHHSFLSEVSSDLHLRYGTLPREVTCTENLTPWTKLLPCRTKTGIATLLNPYRIYDTDFHSMSVHFWAISDPKSGKHRLKLVQTLVGVSDPVRMSASRTKDWSLDFLFGQSLFDVCPAADSSTISVTLNSSEVVHFDPHPQDSVLDATTGLTTSYFAQTKNNNLDIRVSFTNPYPTNDINREQSPIRVHRYLKGYGRERGGITIQLHNFEDQDTTITLFEMIPWFLKVYLHTLVVTNEPFGLNSVIDVQNTSMKELRFQTAIDRVRPAVIEAKLVLPKQSLTEVSFDFDRAFIKYTEHPPDANRGFDIGPCIVTVHDELRGDQRVFSETLLIALPTPDFSMPYNVITMTCTIMALFFGSLFNLLSRSFAPIEDGVSQGKWWQRLLARLKRKPN